MWSAKRVATSSEPGRAGGPVVGDGRLKEVTGAVHLVEVEVGPALAGPLAREVGVEVAVRPLRRGDDGDHLVDHRFELGVGIGTGGQRPGGGFQPLVDVGVVEVAALKRPVELARPPAGGCRSARSPRAAGTATAASPRGCARMPRRPERVVDRDRVDRQPAAGERTGCGPYRRRTAPRPLMLLRSPCLRWRPSVARPLLERPGGQPAHDRALGDDRQDHDRDHHRHARDC